MSVMYPQRSTKIFSISAVGALLLGAAVLAMSSPARAAEDEDDAFDQRFIRGVLEGLGLERDGKAPIDYHERPPLVVPPSRDLMPPEQAGAAVTNNPAWPNDPDLGRRKLSEKLERERTPGDESSAEWGPLRPDQLGPTGNSRARPSGRTLVEGPGADGQRMTPSQLGYKGGIFGTLFGGSSQEGETAQFTGEPARHSLTEPPAGYRTPSPNQPYGVGKAAAPQVIEDSYTTRGEMR